MKAYVMKRAYNVNSFIACYTCYRVHYTHTSISLSHKISVILSACHNTINRPTAGDV